MAALHNSHYNRFPMKIKSSCIKNKQQKKSTIILHTLIAIKPIQFPFSAKPREEVKNFRLQWGSSSRFLVQFYPNEQKIMLHNKFRKHTRKTTLTCIHMPSILMPVKNGNSLQPSQNPKNGQQRVYVATKTKKRKIVKSTNYMALANESITNGVLINPLIDKKERKMTTKNL